MIPTEQTNQTKIPVDSINQWVWANHLLGNKSMKSLNCFFSSWIDKTEIYTHQQTYIYTQINVQHGLNETGNKDWQELSTPIFSVISKQIYILYSSNQWIIVREVVLFLSETFMACPRGIYL